ncbi:GTPase activating protein [Tilletiaria anomala UBC 951]|uniref:GTPase activating protein n=1 Tax=Tilletiaria anomala (strain ATCC 24038 / CBS 436.72 / UBC 951) TaxID=1037660 RepID=A0A066W2K4_TILAU|nr:GTPase activating protein [Tilletiaria anomala UBC 951]KDN46778.1 GTPase activating protein [Tilletiaria anomala UBC 951]
MSGFSTTATTAVHEEAVPTSFDEATLRALCDLDCAMPLLFDRIKQSMVSAREAASFLKKRAAIEEDYARSMLKLSRSSAEAYSNGDGKAGTYVGSWMGLMKVHDQLADARLRFSQKLAEMSDELANLAKEVDKQRRFARETGQKLEKNLQDAEQGVEKARSRFDSSAEDLERLLLVKQGESAKGGELQSTGGNSGGKRTLGKAMGKTGLLFKQKNPQQMLRQEEEIRVKTSNASDAFRKEVHQTQQMRQEYFNMQLPRILRSLKESAEEIDNGTQYHLMRYAFLYESLILSDGMAISPHSSAAIGAAGAPESSAGGLKRYIESMDNRGDFKLFMQNYLVAHGRDYRGPKREGQYDDGFVPPSPGTISKALSAPHQQHQVSQYPIFGVDLVTQMARDNVEVPPILEKCAAAIEAVGIQSMGIYRLSGTTSKVQRLKQKFDQDWSQVDLMNDEAINDINIVAGCLKLWFRELPEPLLTYELYPGFIEAAKISNYRLRHIRLHERVNELPDSNYATLKALMKHLDAIRSHEASNQMSASNLAIVFGPTLLSPPISAGDMNGGAGAMQLQDMSFQCKAIETILEKYKEIFVEDPEE